MIEDGKTCQIVNLFQDLLTNPNMVSNKLSTQFPESYFSNVENNQNMTKSKAKISNKIES